MSRIAKRYGRALFNLTKGDLVKAKRQLEALTVIRGLFETGDAGKVLGSPVMPPDLKRALLDYGLAQANADDDVRHFVATVAEAGRAALLPQIQEALADLIDEAEGVARASVTSAVALRADEMDEISSVLGKMLKKHVTVKPSVDASLLGGFVAHIGNYRIDMSLKTKLEGIAQSAVQDTSL